MPACITHYHFAKAVLQALPEQQDLNLTAFLWGAQGPDFLFCHRYLPFMRGENLREYGGRLHGEIPVKTLGAAREFCTKYEDPVYRSYVFGLLCHYSLDSTAHPYINFLAAELQAARPVETLTTMHGEIEGALDAITLRRETGKLPSEFPLQRCFPKNEPVQRRIAKLYRYMILQALGEEVREDALYQATKDATLVFTLLTDRTGLKKRIFDTIERGKKHTISSHIVPITEGDEVDYANVRESAWTADGTESEKSFFALWDDAKELAVRLIGAFFDCDLKELTKEKPFG